ncbi:hypothetical protein [Pseudaestuariivita rosea]|uniref:hypothetical protein n=1 Tax=Pseudaestuariivita rosea TaxID=2763263 RepID=UPI001ABB5ADF|nr:hypothetical protein [Pseudaestuariivita rosea]
MTQEQLEDLQYLIEQSKTVEMTEDEISKQRRSFAYGNSVFENSKITKEMVDEEACRLGM